jgi:uncharacterized protein
MERKKYEALMSYETLEKLIKRALSSFDQITFIWHGGEPLLAGKKFYQKALDFQQKYRRNLGQRIRNNMQTNGLLLDDECLDFLLKNRFRLGISLDGPAKFHDCNRRISDGKASHALVEDAVSRLARHSGGRAGVISVLTRINVDYPQELYRYFHNSPVTGVSFLPFRGNPSHSELTVSSDQLSEFWVRIFELWIADKMPLKISPLKHMVRALLGGKPGLCSFTGRCFKSFVAVMSNGDIYPCSCFSSKEFLLGNIHNESFGQLLNNNRIRALRHKKNRSIARHCSHCRYIDICAGGCREAAYETHGDIEQPDWTCEARKFMFRYIENRMADLLPGEKQRVQDATRFISPDLGSPVLPPECKISEPS